MSRLARKKRSRKEEKEKRKEKKNPSLFLQVSRQQPLGVLKPKPYAP
jgi:hypothetical protein